MRILFLNSESELYNNGSDKILLLTLQSFAKEHELEVVLPYDGPLVQAIREQGFVCRHFSYAVLRRDALGIFGGLLYFLHLIWSVSRLALYVRTRRIDVVYSNTLSVLEGALLQRLGCCRHIWHIHDMIDEPCWVNHVLSWLVSHCADTAICVSQAVSSHLTVQSDNLKVVWNGIPAIIPEPCFERTGPQLTLAVIGRFNNLKGQADLVRAISILKSGPLRNLEFKMRLVGGVYGDDDGILNATKSLISELGLESCISIEDSVENIAKVYAAIDLLIVPSVMLDPFPTVALEAMSAGKPVVAYRSGGMPEMLAFDDECLADRGDYRMLACRIQPFLENESFRANKAREQYVHYVNHFTLEHFSTRLKQMLAGEQWLHGTTGQDTAYSLQNTITNTEDNGDR